MPIAENVQKAPFKINVEKGQMYSWCSCGYSKTEPFCDGSHKTMAPDLKSIKYCAVVDEQVRFCGCKQSKKGMFCDGSHNGI